MLFYATGTKIDTFIVKCNYCAIEEPPVLFLLILRCFILNNEIISSSSVRVEVGQLDKLMNLVGEIVIDRSRLQQLIIELSSKYTTEEGFIHLTETIERIERMTNQLRESIMHIRMMPIKSVFQKVPRLLRNYNNNDSKKNKIDLVISGQDTELDKTILEELSAPLLKFIEDILENSIKVKIVSEEKESNKKSISKLSINAFNEGNHVIIEITEDGKGLKSAGKFSTTLKKLNGIIDILQTKSKETKYIIKLPLTLAIINALLIKTANQIIAIPLAQVIESVSINSNEIKTIGDMEEVITLRQKVVKLLRLNEYFNLPSLPSTENSNTKLNVVIVGHGEERKGLIVDLLIGQQDIVIKSLDSDMIDVKGIAGATILGEGGVVLILEISDLFNET